jgi:hypothetical protein
MGRLVADVAAVVRTKRGAGPVGRVVVGVVAAVLAVTAGVGVVRLGHDQAAVGVTASTVRSPSVGAMGASTSLPPAAVAALAERRHREVVSRSMNRVRVSAAHARAKATVGPISGQDVSGAVTETVQPKDPRALAMSLLPSYGWSRDEFGCLDQLWIRESNWNPHAENPYSGAYGIPQALPASKMAQYGADWRTNPEAQIRWGLSYIERSYGSPCGAWGFWEAHSWY